MSYSSNSACGHTTIWKSSRFSTSKTMPHVTACSTVTENELCHVVARSWESNDWKRSARWVYDLSWRVGQWWASLHVDSVLPFLALVVCRSLRWTLSPSVWSVADRSQRSQLSCGRERRVSSMNVNILVSHTHRSHCWFGLWLASLRGMGWNCSWMQCSNLSQVCCVHVVPKNQIMCHLLSEYPWGLKLLCQLLKINVFYNYFSNTFAF